MSSDQDLTIPPNPYTRQPIKRHEQLAGRDKELRTIRYYLTLTASGQSPHLALIGQRGVGKTSLLNGTEAITADLKLLPVRIDLNEQKVRSPGEFWHDLYATLILSLAKVGCWGGLQGTIYSDLFKMMHAKQQPPSLDRVVLQIPFAFSFHQGGVSTFSCVDAMVSHDFESCIDELQHKGYSGIALLIDEADCLGINVALLQMLRNIFQSVQRFSLILAGTEAIFPSISEVFSPVPRQFHRIDVKPFVHVNDTHQLVLKPLKAKNIEVIAPQFQQIEELHELCGGDPSEVQLYCHHMYRKVEEGIIKRMALVPQVFREVLKEYRASAPANLETVFNVIEQLPDKYLFESNYLSRRNISLEENARVEIFQRTINKDAVLSSEERGVITWDVKQGYEALFKAGVIEIGTCIRIVGTPLTAAYWKSFVEVEKGKRWRWDDEPVKAILQRKVTDAIAMTLKCQAGHYELDHGDEAQLALHALRNDEPVPEFRDSFREMLFVGILARGRDKVSSVVDIGFQMESFAGRQTFRCRFLENSNSCITQEIVEGWVQSKLELLSSNDILLSILSFSRWEIPTSVEFQRLAWIAGMELPESIFGPSRLDTALSKFGDGQLGECADILDRMYKDKEDVTTGNNLGFCRLLLGQYQQGLDIINKALAKKYDPLFELNKGIALYLLREAEQAGNSLCHALDWLDQNKTNKYSKVNPLYVLFLDPSSHTVRSVKDVPLMAAILINLWRIGKQSKAEIEKRIKAEFPDSHRNILLLIEESH